MDQKIIDLYDEYTHAPLERRVFLERLTAMLGGAALVPAVLGALEPNPATAAAVAPDDRRLEATWDEYQGGTGPVRGYLVRPKQSEAVLPGVIVVHENRGLNPHIQDVARRLALEGFVVIAPDLLSPLGGTPEDADRARSMIGQLDPDKTVQDLVGAMSYLIARDRTNGKVGAVGFCWGGGMVNRLAVKSPDLAAGVVYYGRSPDPAMAGIIKAPLLLHYAGLDQGVNQTVPAYEEALKKAGVRYEKHVYEGVNHAFNNDTSAERYNQQAAELAWDRTVKFLKASLGG